MKLHFTLDAFICLPSKYLDLGMLLTFSLEGKKEVLVFPVKSIAIGGKEGP